MTRPRDFAVAFALLLAFICASSLPAAAFELFPPKLDSPAEAPAAGGDRPQLQWENLVPDASPLQSPLDTLKPDELNAIDAIDTYLGYGTGDIDPALAAERDAAKKAAEAARNKLAKKGIDVDKLYERYIAWQTEVDRRGKATARSLDGKRIAIAGYLLPLDFNAAGAREFLLVPYVGACIHVPPPPPNQVVYVKSSKPYKLRDIFDSVMVSGEMKVGAVSKNLSFMDGASNVDAGYILMSERIEPYEVPEDAQ